MEECSNDSVPKEDTDSGKGGSVESVIAAVVENTVDTADDIADDDDNESTASLEYDNTESMLISSVRPTKSTDKLLITSAAVSGFRPLKRAGCVSDCSEFVFIVEIEWSDGRRSVVTRSFSDFCSFHCHLLDEFARLAESQTSCSDMKMNLYLPGKFCSGLFVLFI